MIETPNDNFQTAYAKHTEILTNEKSPFGQASHFDNGDKSVRPPFSREHYEHFRPDEAIPVGRSQAELHEIMTLCGTAYESVGVIRSIIDMMSEFGAEGVEIIHEDAVPNAFYQAWSKRINLEDRTERFLSYAFKKGNVVIRRKFGKVNSKRAKELANDLDYSLPKEIGRIPLQYVFYDPASVEVVGGDLATISDTKIYGLKIQASAISNLKRPSTESEKAIYAALPPEIKDAVDRKRTIKGHFVVELPADKIYVAHYKKDDTQIWAKPFTYSILQDIQYLRKLKQAKISTLDNMVNITRIWTLGDHKEKLLPHPNAGSKLAGIIGNHTGGGPIDIIWDSAIGLQEFYPPIGELAKLEDNLEEILVGLGIPEGLIGSSEGGTNTKASSMNMKNLVKRLEAGRRMVREWLEYEIDIIQKNMGFRKRPQIRFSNSDLHDEQVYFKLLLDLMDRDVISEERILEIIDEIPGLEKMRVNKQFQNKAKETTPNKASPYHNPQLEMQQKHEITKQKMGEKAQEKAAKLSAPPVDPKERSDNKSKEKPKKSDKPGRPQGSPDKTRRKTRVAKSDLLVNSFTVHDAIHSFTTDLMLKHYKVSTARQLSIAQKDSIELAKRELMANFDPFTKLTTENIVNAYQDKDVDNTREFNTIYNNLIKTYGIEKISIDQKRILMAEAYSIFWSE